MSAVPHHFLDEREAERQAALDRYAIVDTAPEQAFDDIVRLAATVCDVPSAAISLIDHERVWFKAQLGLDQTEVPRAQSLCAQVVGTPRILVVQELLDDPNYAKRRRIGGQPPRFYAGVPLLSPEGHALGVVCVMDVVSRALTPRQVEALNLLARQTQHLLELRRYSLEQGRLLSEREAIARSAEYARDDLQRRHDDLQYVASHDALTGLLNRAALVELQDNPESAQQLHGAPYVMALLDIDEFKQVNDRHGHLLGDRALCAVANAISKSIRAGDIAVRYGGEEFLVVLPNTRLDGAAEVAERIRVQVLAAQLPFPLTVSIGIADGMPQQDTPEGVFERADQALYRAKAGGRNRIIADDTPRQSA